MEKATDDLKELLQVCATDSPRAKKLATLIPVDKLDYVVLVEAQKESSWEVRDLAWKLALRIPKDKLDYQGLRKLKTGADDRDVRSLAMELLHINFPNE